LAQSLNGSMYAAQGASVPVFFNFSVSGQTFVATILTFFTGGRPLIRRVRHHFTIRGLEAFLSLSSGASCACSRDGDLPGH
jgi:hypothetical protein